MIEQHFFNKNMGDGDVTQNAIGRGQSKDSLSFWAPTVPHC